MSGERIEILSIELLDERRAVVESLKRLARSLGIDLGWHYLLDLAWIVGELAHEGLARPGQRILDAGAGMGLLQWHLAETGNEVLSVDRSERSFMTPLHLRRRYRIRGLDHGDVAPAGAALGRALRSPPSLRSCQQALRMLLRPGALSHAPGRVIVYQKDLGSLPAVADSSVDAVVSVSSLEHNTPEQLPAIVGELMRTLKPGGVLLATLGAARAGDWYHAPSQGWNYTDGSLRRLFQLPPNTPSNYADFDQLFSALQSCAELRDGLAPSYFESGDNGMPWGKWAPEYLTVGVRKVKH
jgi:SAM-dependent methyltransferase